MGHAGTDASSGAKVEASQTHSAAALEFHSRQASRPARTSVGMAGAKTALLLAPRARAAVLPMPHAAEEASTSADEANPWSEELAGVRSAWRAAASGIATNFTLAKIAADARKPDGQFRVGSSAASILDFLRDLPCRKVPFLGRVAEKICEQCLGARTCGQLLAAAPEATA